FDLIPEDNTAFVNYALSIYPDLSTEGPTADPDYGAGWHYLKSLTYDAAEAQERTEILQSIITLYYPKGAPTDNGNPDVCCTLDTMNINMVNEEIIVTGGVQPYDISIDTIGNVNTVTVVDFDGCESTVQFTINSMSEEGIERIKIYPNPASTEIYIDLSGSNTQIERLRIVSMHGQVLHQSRKADLINISNLNNGVYILQIELAGGVQISKRVLILR
ncbi:MAG: T9SS type A sorting domain-containing protein, partial [Bacteroidota bacterium]|nr:T9SS type A sorting domain-containing protein [Bacteroidota bacterium]